MPLQKTCLLLRKHVYSENMDIYDNFSRKHPQRRGHPGAAGRAQRGRWAQLAEVQRGGREVPLLRQPTLGGLIIHNPFGILEVGIFHVWLGVEPFTSRSSELVILSG